MPRKPKNQTQYYSLPDEDDAAPAPPVPHVHLDYSADGTCSSATLETPALFAVPQKRCASPSPDADDFPDGNEEDSDVPFNRFDGYTFEELQGTQEQFDALSRDCNDAPLEDRNGKKRRLETDFPLLDWIPHIDAFVEEMLHWDGRGKHITTSCPTPECNGTPSIRCRDCWDARLFCAICVVDKHQEAPLHRIEVWDSDTSYFRRSSLKDIGLRIQLGHPPRSHCPVPKTAHGDSFTIIDSDGIHSVGLDFCGCSQAALHWRQLMQARLFPATATDPRTASTFRVLETFQMLSFTSKSSAYEFYRAIARRTDNTGCVKIPDRYEAFIRTIREWRHIRMLKRAGRGHDPSGAKGTKTGECAVRCPACPIPGVNLPADWATTPKNKQWIYALFVGMDANFRLKRLNVSTEERDPSLNAGSAYVVEETAFKAYIQKFKSVVVEEKLNAEENQTLTRKSQKANARCSNHNAIKSSATKGNRYTASTGVGTVDCARHNMKRANSVGDLQKGESYLNMDYFFMSSLDGLELPSRLVVSYDIACQWSRNFYSRFDLYPPNAITRNPDLDIEFLVPKFHLRVHVQICQVSYSFNLTPGVGRTDGEAPERAWASSNGLAMSTKEMGPGSRRDTIDDYFGDFNWRKSVCLVEELSRKAKDAIKERSDHIELFVGFSAAVPPDLLEEWTNACQVWEKDQQATNPYEYKIQPLTDAEIRLKLAEEHMGAQQPTVHTEVTGSMLILQGIALEDSIQRNKDDVSDLGPNATALQKAKLLEQSNALQKKIDNWIEIQHLYVPCLIQFRAALSDADKANLLLPSSSSLRPGTYDKKMVDYEWRFRIARGHSTLQDLRSQLLLRSLMYYSKGKYATGSQRHVTRAAGQLNRANTKIKRLADRYRKNRIALKVLSVEMNDTSWESELHELFDGDLTGLTTVDNEGPEGRRRLSWLWKGHQSLVSDRSFQDELCQDALRVEWGKTRARAHRWQEECILLREEMRRVQQFWRHESKAWLKRAHDASERVDLDDVGREALVAYAKSRADMRDNMAETCARSWSHWLDALGTMDDQSPYDILRECA